MSLLESIILGIVQGLTEFLPVSSSGHIELGKVLLNVQVTDPLLFSIVVHAATALSTMVVYFRDILEILRDLFKFQWNASTQFVLMIIISMVPVGLVYVFWGKELEELFEGNVILVGSMLIITGGLLWLSSRIGRAHEDITSSRFSKLEQAAIDAQKGEVNARRAWWIGLAQAISILPGISRSGSTISTALMLGMDRAKAARFSFLMVLPVILGGTALQLREYLSTQQAGSPEGAGDISPIVLLAGFVAAFVAGLLACRWMVQLVKRSKLDYFAIYCWIVGVIAVGIGLIGA